MKIRLNQSEEMTNLDKPITEALGIVYPENEGFRLRTLILNAGVRPKNIKSYLGASVIYADIRYVAVLDFVMIDESYGIHHNYITIDEGLSVGIERFNGIIASSFIAHAQEETINTSPFSDGLLNHMKEEIPITGFTDYVALPSYMREYLVPRLIAEPPILYTDSEFPQNRLEYTSHTIALDKTFGIQHRNHHTMIRVSYDSINDVIYYTSRKA